MALVREIRARATYANVIATLALCVAVGGGSFAVAALSGSEKRVVKKIAKKQADKRITARSDEFARVVASDDRRDIDVPNLGNGSCQTQTFVGGPFAGVQVGDMALVTDYAASFLVPLALRQNTAGRVSFSLCNFMGQAFDQDVASYKIVVLR